MEKVRIDNFDIQEARNPTGMGLAAYYNAIFADRGWRLPKHLMPVCNALADERIEKLMLILGPGSGKSQLISVAYPTWRLGLDPTMTIIGVSGAEGLINGFMSAAMEIIEQSSTYRTIFPRTVPDKNAGWSLERGLYVSGRKPGIPDASFWGAGLTSKTLAGKHARTMILDDLHTDINSQTVDQCLKVRDVYYNTLVGRADPFGCRFVLAGRRWHEEDLYGHLMQNEDWVTMVLPAIRDNEERLFYDVYIPDGVECCFNAGATQ